MAHKLYSRHLWYYYFTSPKEVHPSLWRDDVLRTARLHEGQRLHASLRITRKQGRVHAPEWGQRADQWVREQIWLAVKLWEWETRAHRLPGRTHDTALRRQRQ